MARIHGTSGNARKAIVDVSIPNRLSANVEAAMFSDTQTRSLATLNHQEWKYRAGETERQNKVR